MQEVINVILIIIVIGFLLGALFMNIGAKIAKVENATFGKSLFAAFIVTIIIAITGAAFSILPIIGTIFGIVVSLLLSTLVVKAIYNTSYGKAFLALIFYIIIVFILTVIVIFGFFNMF